MKVHTRRKRLLGLSSGQRHRFFFHKVRSAHRPKTFSTEELAQAYAEERGLKKYSIVPAKKTRFKIEM